MKKILLLFGGVVCFSCNSDVEESSKDSLIPNGRGDTENNFSVYSTDSNGYWSPYDGMGVLPPVRHYFENLGNPGLYMKVTAYIGLAYYDGADDGTYNTPNGGYSLNSGSYPSLFANNQEYGNYIPAAPFFIGDGITPPSFPGSYHELAIHETGNDYCQVNNALIYAYNPQGIFFDLVQNNVNQLGFAFGFHPVIPPPLPATQQENDLLAEYGKVMYFKVEYGMDPGVMDATAYYINLECNPNFDLINTPWNDMNLTDNPFNADLYYHGGTGEIVVDAKYSAFNSNYNVISSMQANTIDVYGMLRNSTSGMGKTGGYFIEHRF